MKCTILVICLILLIPACKVGLDGPIQPAAQPAASSSKDQVGPKRSYTKIDGKDAATRRNVGMCELVKGFPRGGGVYKVGTMYSVLEPAVQLPAGSKVSVPLVPFTYVSLTTVTPWNAGAPANPVARIDGGIYPSGDLRLWSIALDQGEEIGLLFYDPFPEPTSNKGFLTIHPQGMFKAKPSGGYSNGDLYTTTSKSLAEIGQLVSQLYQAAPTCPFDVAPDTASEEPAGAAPPPPSSGNAAPQKSDSSP